MVKLMRLEMKKMNISRYLWSVLIANVCITGLLVIIPFAEQNESVNFVMQLSEMNILIGSIVRATFVIFAAVLIAKLIIEEYRDRTITVLFTYPISRKKLMAAKLTLIGFLTFITIVFSNVFVLAIFHIINQFVQIFPDTMTGALWVEELSRVVSFGLATAGTSLVPLYFGMRKKSVPATIISSIIIVAVISQHNDLYSVATIIYIPSVLAVIGIAIAVASIRNIHKIDIV